MTGLGWRTTAGYIARHGARQPDSVALVLNGRTVSYDELKQQIYKLAGALKDLGVQSGSSVAVGCDDFRVHWALLLAFECLNVATASYHHREGALTCRELLQDVDLVISEEHFPRHGANRHVTLTREWLDELLSRPVVAPPEGAFAAGDAVRILRSSGTTGRPKRLLVTRRMYESRMAVYAWQYGFTAQSRYLLTSPFSANPVYGAATACLRAGGTVVSAPIQSPGMTARATVSHAITHLTLQPIMLKQVLDALEQDFIKPDELQVVVLGSALSAELSRRALSHFATEVIDVFGCNELGGVSSRRMSRGDLFAEVAPGIEVETVDEDDRPVLAAAGRLRIRGEAVVEGYVGDPDMTRRYFRNGWFYPGDLAILETPRRLRILGRADHVLNIGGAKALPEDLEALVAARAAVDDVGVCSFPNSEGIEEVYVAVSGVRQTSAELLAQIDQSFAGQQLGSFRVLILPSIPRNAAGKIMRAALKDAIAAAAGLKAR